MYRDENKNLVPLIQFSDSIVTDVHYVNPMIPLDISLSVMKNQISSPIVVFGGSFVNARAGTTSRIRIAQVSSNLNFFVHLSIFADNQTFTMESYYENDSFIDGISTMNVGNLAVNNVVVTGFVTIVD